MYSPETLETLGTQDTGQTVVPVSLDCTFLFVSLVFSNVYLLPTVCPVSCVPNVSSVSGLYILDCLIDFL
jgi:hypothetical protein